MGLPTCKGEDALKKTFSFLALLLLLVFMALPASAESSTTLTVVLPDNYSLDLVIQGKGTVKVGGTSCQSSTCLTLARLDPITIQATPKDGWLLRSIKLNGKAQSAQASGWTLVLDGVTEDMTLEVTFRSTGGSPATGDDLRFFVGLLALSATGLALCLKKRK